MNFKTFIQLKTFPSYAFGYFDGSGVPKLDDFNIGLIAPNPGEPDKREVVLCYKMTPPSVINSSGVVWIEKTGKNGQKDGFYGANDFGNFIHDLYKP